jgi:hypothetical protein
MGVTIHAKALPSSSVLSKPILVRIPPLLEARAVCLFPAMRERYETG